MKFDPRYIIPMEVFLRDYLKLDNEEYEKVIFNTNHYDLDDLNIEGVKRVPNHMVTKEDLVKGSVLLVDSKGFKHKGSQVCAYMRPDLVKADDEFKESTDPLDLDTMIINALYKADTPVCLSKTLQRSKKQF